MGLGVLEAFGLPVCLPRCLWAPLSITLVGPLLRPFLFLQRFPSPLEALPSSGSGTEERKSALQRALAGAWLNRQTLSSCFLLSDGDFNLWRQCPPVNPVSLCTSPGCFSMTWMLWHALPQIGLSFVFVREAHLTTFSGYL